MPYVQAWDEAVPDGATTQADTIDSLFKNLKVAIRERLGNFVDDFDDDLVEPKRLMEGSARIYVDLFANRPAATATLNDTLFFATDTEELYICVAAAWVKFGGGSHQARVSRTTNLATATASATHNPVTWEVEDFDFGGLFDLAGAPTRLTIKQDGRYMIGAVVNFASGGGTGSRWAGITKNGGMNGGVVSRTETGRTNLWPTVGDTIHCIILLAVVEAVATDYFTVETYQDSGVSVNILPAATHFWIQEI